MNKNNPNILQQNLEEENSLKEDELLDRVTKLKSVSIDIQGYLRNEKTTLNRLNNDYDKSIDLVKKSIGSIGNLLKQGFGKNPCYLVFVVLFVFLILYLI